MTWRLWRSAYRAFGTAAGCALIALPAYAAWLSFERMRAPHADVWLQVFMICLMALLVVAGWTTLLVVRISLHIPDQAWERQWNGWIAGWRDELASPPMRWHRLFMAWLGSVVCVLGTALALYVGATGTGSLAERWGAFATMSMLTVPLVAWVALQTAKAVARAMQRARPMREPRSGEVA